MYSPLRAEGVSVRSSLFTPQFSGEKDINGGARADIPNTPHGSFGIVHENKDWPNAKNARATEVVEGNAQCGNGYGESEDRNP